MEHWIGIDVSSATLDFALLDGKGTHLESVQIENDRKAVMKLMGQWSKRHGVEVGKSLICLEATGHYTRQNRRVGRIERTRHGRLTHWIHDSSTSNNSTRRN